jgi:hypothetical protein
MNENPGSAATVVCIIIIIWLGIANYDKSQYITKLGGVIQDCSDTVDQANQNIDEANSSIEDAQGMAWSDYDSMGDALDGLSETEDVDNPCQLPEK